MSVFIRDFERSTWFDGHKTDFILDVDHHARACWWSTSENSEKCPRVMRGKTSVPSEIAFYSDLTRICEEFVSALTVRAIYDRFSFTKSEVSRRDTNLQ